jgi:arginyl-tRNA--protein-N-Asp/Glu arginylyltransferase
MTSIPLYVGGEHECDYLPGRQARMVYVPPDFALHRPAYSRLAANGFRRSGDWVYRPYCRSCTACIPVRIPVAGFALNRSQRRIRRLNSDLSVHPRPAVFDESHYRLYRRYLQARHAEGAMALSSREDYLGFVASSWGDTGLYEFRSQDRLLAVAVVDHLEQALSAVYTFYDPDRPLRSLGTYAVLWQIEEARRRGLEWVYLGFWIAECRKMAYKGLFRPVEALLGERWVRLDKGENVTA